MSRSFLVRAILFYRSRSVVTLPNRVVSVWFTAVALFLAMMQRARSRSRSHSRAENGLSALQFADSAMKADRDVVIAAVQWNGHALQYAAPAILVITLLFIAYPKTHLQENTYVVFPPARSKESTTSAPFLE